MRFRGRGPRTLRWRLVGIIAVLIAATGIVVGTVTIVSLHSYLVQQLDSRLTVASQRSQDTNGTFPSSLGPGARPPGAAASPPPGKAFIGAPGQSPNTVVAVISDGRFVVNGFVDPAGTRHALGAESQKMVRSIAADGRPTSKNLGSPLGSYRVVANRVPGGDTVVTGLPLAPVDAVTERLVILVAIITLSGLLIAAVAAAVTVQRTLRPLRRVASTASAVTGLDLDRDDVPVEMRVNERDIESASEVGHVGLALNRLLGHVSAALRARRGAESKMRAFVADASHELRTPLSIIRAYAELSRHDYPEIPDGLRRNIERIESESVRMSGLVEELLLLARIDSDATIPRVDRDKEADISRLLAETISDAQTAAPDHRWVLSLPSDPLVVAGDEAQLRRVFVNIFANARVHTPSGTEVDAALVREPDGSVTVAIRDDGPGIPEAMQPLVFERFARGDASRSREAGSTGLGLAIVRAVVTAHGGVVAVDSRPGCTIFRVHLPSRPSLSDAQERD